VATNEAGRATRTTPTNKTAPPNAKQSRPLVLRPDIPPVNELDVRDRHLTRRTDSEEMSLRYAEVDKNLRRDEWHYLIMSLVVFIVTVAVYVAGFVVLSRLDPHLNPRQVAQTVALAFAAAGGGVAVRSAGRALKQLYTRPSGRRL
jgi:hypothetical protein